MIPDKKEFVRHCIKFVEAKLSSLLLIQAELGNSLHHETKSTAGDKHETARAMLQLEQEKLGKQIKEWELVKESVEKLSHNINMLANSQLIETDKGLFFVYCHLGKIEFNGQTVMGISPASPLGNELLKQKEGGKFNINSNSYLILKKH